jgi:hypothetical protein
MSVAEGDGLRPVPQDPEPEPEWWLDEFISVVLDEMAERAVCFEYSRIGARLDDLCDRGRNTMPNGGRPPRWRTSGR